MRLNKKKIKELVASEIDERNINIDKTWWIENHNGVDVYGVLGKAGGKIFRCEYSKTSEWNKIERLLFGEEAIFDFEKFYSSWHGQATEAALLFWGGQHVGNKIVLEKNWIPTSWKRGNATVWKIEGDDPFIAPGHKNFEKWLNG